MSTETNYDASHTLSIWVEKYSDEMFSWAYYKTSNRELAEDIVQDCFVSAFKAFERFKTDSNPKTWLFTILNNKIIDHYRSKASNRTITETELKAGREADSTFNEDGIWANMPNANWEEEQHLLDNEDFLKVLEKCIDNLPEKWKAVTIAKYFDYKKGSSISQELGITSSNLWQIVHRSKLKLKQCLDANWKTE